MWNLRIFFLLLSLCLAASTSVYAAEYPRPRCGGTFDLCGFVDSSGNLVIPRRFEKARAFQSDLAAVRVDGLWGFIRQSGEIAIQPRFQAVGDFRNSRAEAVRHGRTGVIDRDGEFVIPPRFSRAVPFTEDVALVSDTGSLKPERIEQIIRVEAIFKSFRLFHRQDGWLTGTPQDFRWLRRPGDGSSSLIWASGTGSGKLYGLMDDRGNWVVRPRFGHVQTLNDGLAVVRGSKRNRGWGAVDENGHVVIPLKYHWLSYFKNGYAILGGPGGYGSRKHGLIRSDGVVIAEPVFDQAQHPEGDSAGRVKRGNVWSRVEVDGRLVAEQVDDRTDETPIASCPQGLRIKRQGVGYLVEDSEGRPALPEPVIEVSFGIPNDDGSISGTAHKSNELDCRAPIPVRIGKSQTGTSQSTYIKPDGRSLFDPPRLFASVTRFSRGYAVVRIAKSDKPGEWGIINTEGRFTLALGPERIWPYGRVSKLVNAPIFKIGERDNARLTDAQGKPAIGVEEALDKSQRQRAVSCRGGARIAGDGERFGIAAPDGKVLVPAIHRAIGCFRNGVAWAPRDDRKKWCPIGVDGKFRDVPACLPAFYPVRVSHHYPEHFDDDPYENSVLWMRAMLRYGFKLRQKPPRWVGDGRSRSSYSVAPFRP